MKNLSPLLSIVCLFLLQQIGYAQSEKRDSLEQQLTKDLPDSLRIKTINLLLFYYSDIDTERAVELAKQALALVDRTDNPYDIGRTYLNYALFIETIGEYETSLEYNSKALAVFKSLNDSASISIILNNMGIGYNQLGDYSMAVYYLLRAIETDEARGDTLGVCYDYINISESYYNAKNFVAAEVWAKKSFNLLRQLKNETELGYAAETLATAFIELGKLDSAKILIALSKDLALKFNNEYLINRCTSHMGRVFLKEGNYDSARIYFLNAIKLSQGKHFSDVLLPSLILLSKTYLKLGREKDALTHAEESYRKSTSVKNKFLAMESSTVLAEIHHVMGQSNQAIKYLHLASLYKDTILDQSVRGSMQAKAFDINLENEKRAHQRAQLGLEERDKVLLRQRYLLSIGGILLLSLLTVMYLIRKAGIERKKTNDQLISNNLQLNKLNQEVNGLINTIVHDLKAPLNSMQGILHLLEQDVSNKEVVSEMIKHGHRVLEGGHEIIKELLELRELEQKTGELNLEDTNLKKLVEELGEEFLPYATGKQIDLNWEGNEDTVRIDSHMVRRLLGNLLSNAIKYTPHGKRVELRAWQQHNIVYFEVADNGQGFREADLEKMYQKFQKLSARPTGGESSHGLGLAIVQLLVKRLDATIALTTEWGKGSTFLLSIPLQ